MNALIIVFLSGALFFLAYRFYGRKLEALWRIDPKRPTPAFSKFDSLDYIPARNWPVLFGHHFASISGAGPVIGPVIAVLLWGWGPALLWVVLGTIFIGGIHDFGSLITSVREGGSSIADIAGRVVSKRAKVILALFLWLALVLVIAVFAYLCADSFIKEPRVAVPSLGLIPIALFLGYLLYRLRMNTLLATFCALILVALLLPLGNIFRITAGMNTWLLVLFAYCYLASILPVNILLQPRDYIASFLLIFGVGAGYLGLLFSNIRISMPAYHSWSAPEGTLWPMLFVTVACGAVSGFHTLVAGGTSSKQIANERDCKKIGYGAMIAEGLVAVLALIAVGALFSRGDDFAGALKEKGPIAIFAQGYGMLTRGILRGYGPFIALTILNAFILTTLDSATRITRYLTEELFGIKNRFLSTAIVVFSSAALALSGKWKKLWLAFGASNQLVAALALFILSCWLLSKKRPARFTLWPAFFMLATTLAALMLQAGRYFMNRDFLLFSICVSLVLLAAFMVYELSKAAIYRAKRI